MNRETIRSRNRPAWRRITTVLLATCLILFLLAARVTAMSSPNYRLDWITPFTSGGGPMTSTNYQINVTIGQTATGPSASANYQAGLGFWYGVADAFRNFLPLIRR
jgi:hypothetical protein